jgi:Kef-type K+ transport system membrane component KefB
VESDYLFALLEIFILIFVAEIVRSYMGRYGLPLIIGEIITGIILSPYGFGEAFNKILVILTYDLLSRVKAVYLYSP